MATPTASRSAGFPAERDQPYGQTKLMIETILRDLAVADPAWRIAILRYFNPVGAHASGRIGEDPNGIPNQPAALYRAGGDRQAAHAEDLRRRLPDARRHRRARLYPCGRPGDRPSEGARQAGDRAGVFTYNLGTGRGYSVLEVLAAFERACGKQLPYQIADRRPGDSAANYAEASRANQDLGWAAEHDIDAMCADAWRWQSANSTRVCLKRFTL